MPSKMFVNLPVKDLPKSVAFFEALGFSKNAQFSDETAAGIVFSENYYAMLLTHPKFQEFTDKEIADATKTTEIMTALLLESKEAVDAMIAAAVAAGGKEPRPAQDYGFMYQRTFEDPDGHIWEPFWMDPDHVQKS